MASWVSDDAELRLPVNGKCYGSGVQVLYLRSMRDRQGYRSNEAMVTRGNLPHFSRVRTGAHLFLALYMAGCASAVLQLRNTARHHQPPYKAPPSQN